MNDSTSNQLNDNDLVYSSETNDADETRCVVDEKFVPKVGMIFKTLEETRKFYKYYSKLAGFSTKIRNTTRDGDKIKNQLIVCTREGRWKSKISPTLKINPSAGLNCPARIYVHIMKDVGLWTISKVVLNHSHPCCPDRAEMLKQHRELSMFVRCTIETNEKDGIRPNKTYQSFVTAAGNHCELSFIEKDVRNYITREVRNISKEDDAKEFGKNWNDFLTKYSLGGNKWLSGLYKDRHIWIPLYLNHHFCAGMRSTQRSESMHSFFNKFITCNTSLRQFVKQYDNCLASREQREREFDAADFYTVIPCATKSAIEAQFQHGSSSTIQRKSEQHHKINASTLGFRTYEVVEQVSNSTFNKFLVTYDAVSREVKCQCLLFESRGILCRHSLNILSFERVDNVAPRYILERWSKNIKRRHTHIKSSQDEPLLEPRSKRLDDFVFRSHNICEFASQFEELTRILHWAFDKVMAEMQEYQEKSKGKSSLSHEEATLSDMNELQSLPHIKTRGRPKNRLGSNLEKKISNATKKKKKTAPTESSSTFYNAPDMNYPREDYMSFRLERTTDGFGSLITSDSQITWSLILFISCNRRFGPNWYLKSSISSYISIERN
ncbi:hypothetical protein Ahy_A07g033754 [Arachis hypogaea]|uniref:Protein FAR1-RELATED SEQUENCE n=1 Tax=Arachis hypogaea TaxID=3818 RepID=A0A445CA22_ARAHY|nr:hypothetical protein Ahy_A07g033754 [Arachis hypogaea]